MVDKRKAAPKRARRSPEDVVREHKRRMTPEAVKALSDKVIEEQVIPKRIPAADDIDGQTQALGGALANALLTATEMPLHMLQPVVGDLAAQLVAQGVRQTDLVDPEALHVPAWITDGVRQESVKLPEQPEPTEAAPVVVRTGVAPACPKRIAKSARAVRR